MNLNSKKLTINGTEFVVKEARVCDLLPLMPRFQGEEAAGAQLELVANTVYLEGAPLGEKAQELPFNAYTQILEACLSVNGMGEDSGND